MPGSKQSTKKSLAKQSERQTSQIQNLEKAGKQLSHLLTETNKGLMTNALMIATLVGTLKKKGLITDEDLMSTFNDSNKKSQQESSVRPEETGSNAGSVGDAKVVPPTAIQNSVSGSRNISGPVNTGRQDSASKPNAPVGSDKVKLNLKF